MTEPSPPPFEITTSAVSKYDELLLDNFAKDVAAQSTRLDDLAKQLITLNIAIPGLYATVLKFISGETAVVNDPVLLIITFAAWLLALDFALASLFPHPYTVDPDSPSEIETFFYRSAQHKRKLLAAASLLSFFGICFAVFSLFV